MAPAACWALGLSFVCRLREILTFSLLQIVRDRYRVALGPIVG
jgi:hypothetical protein